MGANQSSGHPRTVNIENESPIGVIDVSDDVVQRLKSGLAKAESAKKATQTTVPVETATPATAAPIPTEKPSTPIAKKPNVSAYTNPYPTPHQSSGFKQYSEPSITAIEVRREKEIELQQNDAYWRQRMSQLEQTLNKTNAIMEKEYSTAIEDVRKRFTNAPAIHQLPPCQEFKAKLIACYRANPGETLKCSEEVAAFTNCVSENRVKKLDAAIAADAAANGQKAKAA